MSIGYACLVYGISGFKLKSCRLSNSNKKNLIEITKHNLDALFNIIEYNSLNKIKLFRISSDIIPLASHPEVNFNWKDLFSTELKNLGEVIISSGIRVSMHPGQYTVINSNRPEVIDKSILDLNYHCEFLDSLELDSTHKVVLHIGGVYGDKTSAIERFKSSYMSLSSNLKSRLIIENDEKSYNISDLLSIGKSLGIPVVFDNLHHSINSPDEQKSEFEWIYEAGLTWKSQDGPQKIHYSQQRPGGKPGSHSQSIDISNFLDFYSSLRESLPDIMLEVKDKNISAIKCSNCVSYLDIHILQLEWARYKYLVLYHSHLSYLAIRAMFRENRVSAIDVYSEIDSALREEPTLGSMVNTFTHVWGYFKDICSEKERDTFKSSLESFEAGSLDPSKFKKFLFKLSKKYDVKYLLESYFFYDVL